MKKLLNLTLLLVIVSSAFAQRDPQYSFNMFNHMAINPGFAGISGGICARGIYHEQWIGFESAPTTMVLSADMELKSFSSGVGINVIKDNEGFNRNLYFNANYAYHLKVGDKGKLGIGVGLGLLQNSISGEWLGPDMLQDPNRTPDDDPSIPKQETHYNFDANMGLFYQTTFDKYNEMYAGLSVTHLTEPTMTADNSAKGNYFPRTYYLDAGYHYTMPNGVIQLRPSVLFKTEMVAMETSVNLTALYNQMFWAGVSYSTSNQIIVMAGATLKNNLSFGVAYAYYMSEINTIGSLDVMVKYCFGIKKQTGKGSTRSVRFL